MSLLFTTLATRYFCDWRSLSDVDSVDTDGVKAPLAGALQYTLAFSKDTIQMLMDHFGGTRGGHQRQDQHEQQVRAASGVVLRTDD